MKKLILVILTAGLLVPAQAQFFRVGIGVGGLLGGASVGVGIGGGHHFGSGVGVRVGVGLGIGLGGYGYYGSYRPYGCYAPFYASYYSTVSPYSYQYAQPSYSEPAHDTAPAQAVQPLPAAPVSNPAPIPSSPMSSANALFGR